MSKHKRERVKGRLEGGSFKKFSDRVFKSKEFYDLSFKARALLLDIYMQYNGSNNGDFCIAPKIMRPKGWTSQDQLHKAKKELINSGWIIETRKGGRNRASLYSVTYLPINDCKGKLDVKETLTPLNYWKAENRHKITNLCP